MLRLWPLPGKLIVSSLEDVIISYISVDIWYQFSKTWLYILKTLVCAKSILRPLQGLKDAMENRATSERRFFFLFVFL